MYSTRFGCWSRYHAGYPPAIPSSGGATETSLLSGHSAGPVIPRNGTLLGALFESLIALNLRV